MLNSKYFLLTIKPTLCQIQGRHLLEVDRGILVYNICLISISNSVFDGATNKTVLNIERS